MEKTTKRTTSLIDLWACSASNIKKIDANLGSVHGIGFIEYMILNHLTNSPNNMMRRVDLATALSRTASGITRMLLPMEKIGLVKKEDNPRDARVSFIKITETGVKIHSEATVSLNAQSALLSRRLKDSQIETLMAALDEIKG